MPIFHQNLPWIITISTFSLLVSLSVSDPRTTESHLFCSKTKSPNGLKSVPTFTENMGNLSNQITTHHFGTHFVNSTSPMYGLAQCHRDLSQTDCLLCFVASRSKLPICLPSVSALIFNDGCFVRYDNYSFFGESIDPFRDSVNCSEKDPFRDKMNCSSETGANVEKDHFRDTVNCSSKTGPMIKKGDIFTGIVHQMIDNLTEKAVLNGGFGVMAMEREDVSVYGLAQCWESVSKEGCRECLEKAGRGVSKCVPETEGRGLNTGCYLRYSTHKFYDDGDKEKKSGFFQRGIAVAIILCIAVFVIVLLLGAYAKYGRFSKTKHGPGNLRLASMSFKKSDLHYKYETLEKATDYFNESRKLGQGGSGSVYKGTLPNGEVVAVKRLIFNTRQWVDEFFNEVNLIRDIQHKNLVMLLGCSIEGPESLLVYEYVTNKSLDQFIFDKSESRILNWDQRLHIIIGIAEGLAYLHGGSQTRIIHRDIKSSNILLDENLNAKIADFGLVRCFAPEQSHLSTGIAGTLGYMAPEYLVRGQLTEKSDVYSFGVLLLETICGKRSNVFIEKSGSVLQMVWRLYKLNRLSECVDPYLKHNFPVKEASNVLQIGLLCTQASVALRPSMEEVIHMLTHKDCEIPIPNQPPFMNSSVLNQTSSTGSYSINSNTATKIEVSSYTSSEFSSSSLGAIGR